MKVDHTSLDNDILRLYLNRCRDSHYNGERSCFDQGEADINSEVRRLVGEESRTGVDGAQQF